MTPARSNQDRHVNPDHEPIYDAWTPYDYKQATIRRTGRVTQVAPDWTGWHKRRLTAYNVLSAYLSNAARRLLPGIGETADSRRDNHREYGDPAAFRTQIRAALLGDTQEIICEGAADYDPELDEPPAEGEQAPDDDAKAANAANKQALDMQEWLQEWAEAERFILKLIEVEDNAVGLGDGVWSLGWNADKSRTKLRVWDPSFYFPVLEDGASEDDYPRRVHIAWEIPPDPEGDQKVKIRRITWELGPIVADEDPAARRAAVAEWRSTGEFPEGTASRTYEWNDEASQVTCYMTDATFVLDSGKPADIESLTMGAATFNADTQGPINMRDLEHDFVPVIHVPNTVALLNHFGRSSIGLILQVFDDLSASDTDLQAASATTGTPIIGVFGVNLRTEGGYVTYQPGQVFQGSDGGRMDVMDTSTSLDALLKYVESLLGRASINAHLPEEVLGRIEKGEVSSGIELRLRFGPMERMVREMRLVREEKYPLLLKFAWRIARAHNDPSAPKDFVAGEVTFGSFLPADQKAILDEVVAAYQGGVMSLETAVARLIEAGIIDGDVQTEIEQIQARDYERAGLILDATGREDLLWEFLGVKPPPGGAPALPPVVALPGTENGPEPAPAGAGAAGGQNQPQPGGTA